jgi:hypothetical protein
MKETLRVVRHKIAGAVLASAVGVMFMAQPLLAQDSGHEQSQAQVKCVGGNSCKGQSACKSASNSCKGQNACKGKGYVMASNSNECTEKGGHVEKQ